MLAEGNQDVGLWNDAMPEGLHSVCATAISAMPSDMASHTETLPELDDRFYMVEKSCREAIFAEGKEGVMGRIWAKICATVMFSERSERSGETNQARLCRAGYALATKDLSQAITELESLTGEAKEVASSWVDMAKRRLYIDQTLLLLRSHNFIEVTR